MIVYASVVEPNNEGLEENISYTLINHGTSWNLQITHFERMIMF